jgi:oxygen-independent coproporphyrinogen-3 oxidase
LKPLGVYIHWPYCQRVCPYCDFNVVRDRGRSQSAERLIEALAADLAAQAQLLGPRALVSIYFGGGTPSLMPPGAVGRLIETARACWPETADLEVTLEANPGDADRLPALAQAGVNRVSLGLQSLDDAELRFLGRNHDAASARRAAALAQRHFDRVSLDLIYALPGQSLAQWTAMLTEVAAMGAEHISAYELTIEPRTAFGRAARRGQLTAPGHDHAAEMFETTAAVLSRAGYEAYEVSNHARGSAARSRHNLVYWRGEDYLGVGPGAHGRLTIDGRRYASEAPAAVADYVARVKDQGVGVALLPLPSREVALERLIMGLRTIEGVAIADLAPLKITSVNDLADFLSLHEGRLTATARGRPVLDRVIAELARAA